MAEVPYEIPVLRDYAAEWINGKILRGDLRPGDRLDPAIIARELGVSHIPVREAMQGLAGEGRVTHIPRRGFFIPSIDFETLESVYHWLSVIESEGYKLAMPLIRDEDVAKMTALYHDMDAAYASDDTVAYRRTHRRFHFVPLDRELTKLPVRFLQYLWDEAERYSVPKLASDRDIPRLQQHHLELTKAFADRDTARVLAIMAEHRHQSHLSDQELAGLGLRMPD